MICGVRDYILPNTNNSTVQWNAQNWAKSCDFNGNYLQYIRSSVELCSEKCAETQQCTHYTWTNWTGGTCWMKMGNVSKADAFPTADATMICGIVNETKQSAENYTVQWNGQNWAMSCDFNGNDLSHVEISAELCGKKCAETKQCTHYAWMNWTGSICYMKTGDVSKNDAFFNNDPGMICGIVNENQQGITNSTVQWNGQNWAMSCDFHGNDLSHVEISAALCGGKCAETQQCTHYTWTTFNGGTCWMKIGNVSKADAFSTSDTTMVCGLLTSVKRRNIKLF
ncbi:unnamed protein product [Rotaria sp. Silwood2]|nr:unnamed protein product [Rotaria sp. Silwood2]CAF2762887.1 unnamed protein product [Rotaria sp. Silwood2]CAF3217686.1 unnamed protein product [Rotaria sp. Silwood2]CAF4127152.1 unnamed protein product [Rotaria sp. Silwood2]CAF4233929.1 unnamed protein product [Rotaria sp. Silwood2]